MTTRGVNDNQNYVDRISSRIAPILVRQNFTRTLALVLLVVFCLLFFFPSLETGYSPVEGRMADAAHLPLIFGFSLVSLLLLWQMGLSSLKASIWVAVVMSSGTALVELLQPYVGRSASLTDWIFGIYGLGIALVLNILLRREVRSSLFLWGAWIVGSASLVLLALYPAWLSWNARMSQLVNFPLLGDFETSDELYLWKPSSIQGRVGMKRTNAKASRGEWALELSARGSGYAGVEYALPEKSWEGYSTLGFKVYSLEIGGVVNLRIDDCKTGSAFEDRFNRAFNLGIGWNSIEVPMTDIKQGPSNRELDFSCLTRFVIFSYLPAGKKEFVIDDVRLIK